MRVNTHRIADRLMMANLSYGKFGVTRVNQKESREINVKHGVTQDVAKVLVKLFGGGTLAKIGTVHSQAYERHCKMTLPTLATGWRIVPSVRNFDYSSEMAKFRDQHEALVKEFVEQEYPSLKIEAPSRLLGLYDARQWPEPEDVYKKFRFSIRLLPVPDNDAWSEWIKDTVEIGADELRDRITSALYRITERTEPGAKVYKSAFEDLGELASLAEDFDIDQDVMEQLLRVRELALTDLQHIRENDYAKECVNREASDLLAAFRS